MAEAPHSSRPLNDEFAGTGSAGATGQAGASVLVVDDDEDITRFFSAVLASRGLSTVTASDPIRGFLTAQREQPKLIFVDWHMPAGGGAQLLRKLRDNPKTADIPVIVVTSDSMPNLAREATALGARLFLHKPLDPERLAEIVGKILS